MLNKVLLIGNLVDDPKPLRTLQSGASVTDFRMAVNEPGRNRDEGNDRTLFIDVTVWNKTAENVCRYLTKGRQVLVDGKLEQDTWQDKETGQNRSKIKVVAFQVTFMGGRDGEGGGGGGGGYRDDRDDRGSDRGGYRERDDRSSGGGGGGGSRSGGSSSGGGGGSSSPLKDYGLDDEVPF